jgi:adenylate cyclase
MQLSSTLSWLLDAAGETPGADRLLAELGAHLVEDGLPLAGGALTLAVPHPLIARRTWLWQAENGQVIEALGFVTGELAAVGTASPPGDAGRRWLAGLAAGLAHEDTIGPRPDAPSLGWIGPRPFTPGEADELHRVARFAAAPLAVLAARATLTAALEAYLGRRSAARVLAGPLRRGIAARPSRLRCSMPICAASRPCPRAIPLRQSSPLSTPGSIVSPAPFTPSAAKC